MGAERPYTVATLAQRWACSEGTIRNMIRRGELAHIRLGTLIRIPASEVERIECPNTASNDTEADTLSSGPMEPESGIATSLPRPIASGQRPKLGNDGGSATVHRGPWAA